MNKLFIHLKTIFTHKYWVFKYCCKCGIPIRGLLHDMSKFSPSELIPNLKYIEPGKSPINVAKEKDGYSKAWMHHKSHNPHHYEYWMDRFDNGCYVTRMPFECMVECLCDYLAANRAYNPKEKKPYHSELEWWKKERKIKTMHPDNIRFLDHVLMQLDACENKELYLGKIDSKTLSNMKIKNVFKKKNLKQIYDENTSYSIQVKISDIPRFSFETVLQNPKYNYNFPI